jgi:peptide deformylase
VNGVAPLLWIAVPCYSLGMISDRVCGEFLAVLGALLATAGGCAGAHSALNPEEYARLARGKGAMSIVTCDPARPDPTSILRQRALPVSAEDPDLTLLTERMAATMQAEQVVGLAAPQIGVSRRVIMVRHGVRPVGQPTRLELYLNPRIEWASAEQDDDYEACASVAGVGGLVPRARRITMTYETLGARARQRVELGDWDARIVQHEIDHLEGVLFVDRLRGGLLPLEEMRRLRDAAHRAKGWMPTSQPASTSAPHASE